MWFYPIFVVLVLLAIAGAIFGGGIFTIVLVPLAVIALGSALAYTMWTRSQAISAGAASGQERPHDRPLPHQAERAPSRVTATPEQLVDRRRQQQ